MDRTQSGSDVIELNVGGRYFVTSMSTLGKEPGSALTDLLRKRTSVKDNRLFVDADGETFHHILEYLRNDTLPPVSVSAMVYKVAHNLRLRSLMQSLNCFLPVIQMKQRVKLRSLFPKYKHIFSKIETKIESRKVHEKSLAINIPIYVDRKGVFCSFCTGGVEICVYRKDSTMTALIELITMDLNERGFEFDIRQAECKNNVRGLNVLTVGTCSARIITLQLKL